MTCACDANRDGKTNPAPINGNNRVSINADDDGGFFREKAAAYYADGAMPLPFCECPAQPDDSGDSRPPGAADSNLNPSPASGNTDSDGAAD